MLNYIWENKKKVLPNAFFFLVICVLAWLPIPTLLTTVLFLIYFPFAIRFFFLALSKTEEDNLSWWNRIFICVILPFLFFVIVFLISIVIYEIY